MWSGHDSLTTPLCCAEFIFSEACSCTTVPQLDTSPVRCSLIAILNASPWQTTAFQRVCVCMPPLSAPRFECYSFPESDYPTHSGDWNWVLFLGRQSKYHLSGPVCQSSATTDPDCAAKSMRSQWFLRQGGAFIVLFFKKWFVLCCVREAGGLI